MFVGAQVSAAGGAVLALDRGAAIGAEVIQIFVRGSRSWRSPPGGEEAFATFRAEALAHPDVHATYCHATYLINLAASEPELAAASRRSLYENLSAATAIGAAGLVLHLGSHRGRGFDAVLPAVAAALVSTLGEVEAAREEAPCILVLENTAGSGGTIGRSFSELARVLEACAGDERIGFCLDTQHLFAAGVPYRTLAEADAVIDEFDRLLGLERLACLHLNDSKVGLGANADRHENLGRGHIGAGALASLVSHPRLAHVPAILEVPGEGKGPGRADLALARRLVAEGTRRRDRRTRRLLKG